MNKLFRLLVLAVFWSPLGFACAQQGLDGLAVEPFSVSPMVEPGDEIDSMVITTGAEDATPLWAFCSAAQHVGNTTTSDCSVPIIPRLAIGHIFMPGDYALTKLD